MEQENQVTLAGTIFTSVIIASAIVMAIWYCSSISTIAENTKYINIGVNDISQCLDDISRKKECTENY